ncbi:chemotaxis protein CheW [Marinospirillum sp.]|uniref:chemotaxis protein CheW n=1 Tax=Marinospirillum sp. TaxID=2183934 RepID=UPI003A88439C
MTPEDELAAFLAQGQLASPSQDALPIDLEQPQIQLVIFTLGEDYFALRGGQVKEVLSAEQPVFALPGQDQAVEGVLTLRGQLYPVWQAERLLGLSAEPNTAATSFQAALLRCEAEVDQQHHAVVVRVGQLVDVLEISEDRLQAPSNSLTPSLAVQTEAVFEWQGQGVTLLDLHRVMQDWWQRRAGAQPV